MSTDPSKSRREFLLQRIPQMTLGGHPKWKSTKFPPDVVAEWEGMREDRKGPSGIMELTQTTIDVARDFEETWAIIDVTTKFDEEHTAYYKSYSQDWETLNGWIDTVMDDCRTYLGTTVDVELAQKKRALDVMWTRLKAQGKALQPHFDEFRKRGLL